MNPKHLFTRALVLLLALLGAGQALAARTTTYFHTDALGSVVAATSEAGAVLWRKDYAPYGAQLPSSTGTEKISYTGKPHDAQLGITNFGARQYDPEIGRFLNVDPVGFVESNPMSFNRYLYVNNNPYKYVDPDGEFLNFVAKFVLDVGVNVAINYLTTGELSVGSALKDSATGILNPAKTVAGIGKLAMAASKARTASKAAEKVKYIGKVDDLKGVPRNQTFLDDLPDRGSPKANWKQNSSVLRKARRDGIEIRDASAHRNNFDLDPTPSRPDRKIGQSFLGAERNLLNNHGGNFDSSRAVPRKLPQ
jgi:RHS repeat-associated protein